MCINKCIFSFCVLFLIPSVVVKLRIRRLVPPMAQCPVHGSLKRKAKRSSTVRSYVLLFIAIRRW